MRLLLTTGFLGGLTTFSTFSAETATLILHEQHFFELAGDLTVEVEFMLSEEQAEKFLEFVRSERVHLFYAKLPAEFDIIEGQY